MFILKTIKKRNWTAMNPTTWMGNQLTLFSITTFTFLCLEHNLISMDPTPIHTCCIKHISIELRVQQRMVGIHDKCVAHCCRFLLTRQYTGLGFDSHDYYSIRRIRKAKFEGNQWRLLNINIFCHNLTRTLEIYNSADGQRTIDTVRSNM